MLVHFHIYKTTAEQSASGADVLGGVVENGEVGGGKLRKCYLSYTGLHIYQIT